MYRVSQCIESRNVLKAKAYSGTVSTDLGKWRGVGLVYSFHTN